MTTTPPPPDPAVPPVPSPPGAMVPPAGAIPAAPATPGDVRPPVRRRTWDVVLTIVLLAIGFFGMGLGLLYAAAFADPATLEIVLPPEYYDVSRIDGRAFAAAVAISHPLLYLAALGSSIPLLVRGRMVVFWIPLTAGVIAAAVFWGGLIVTVAPGMRIPDGF